MTRRRTWFITGAGSGFGLLLTQKLLAQGEGVAATTRSNLDGLHSLQALYPEHLWVKRLDMTDTKAIAPTVEEAFQHFGSIDMLVSNAGYVLLGALEEITTEQINHQLDTNLRGPITLVRAFLPYFRAQKHGRILQLSSEAGQMTYPALTLYHASKWGIEGFCEALAKELKQLNITVTIIEPGRTATSFDDNAVQPPEVLEAYQRTTVGAYRKLLAMGRFPYVSDAHKVVEQMIEAATSSTPPLRLTLGVDAYRNIHKSLQERLNALESQQEIAQSVGLKR